MKCRYSLHKTNTDPPPSQESSGYYKYRKKKILNILSIMILTTAAFVTTLLAVGLAFPQQPYNRPRQFNTASPVSLAPAQQLQGSNPNAVARILRQEQDNQYDGTFNYAFETENGISQQATGSLKNPGTEQQAQVVQGSYSYTSPEGQLITITYIADEDGFKAQGDAIPTSPPIPEAIARALDYIRSLPPDPNQKQF